ncbi:hypothetical protein DICVIV_03352 [Dictyocaulus viviparus]|uniref:Uncharacterized protein n=1 Tax=Dictyocaulus viviparus TaxID=29172 RepID=A0A0D8Y2V1_DICVI|nr:hypothetical protein DICVIV_03352 [Dictyocaulus viviparus]
MLDRSVQLNSKSIRRNLRERDGELRYWPSAVRIEAALELVMIVVTFIFYIKSESETCSSSTYDLIISEKYSCPLQKMKEMCCRLSRMYSMAIRTQKMEKETTNNEWKKKLECSTFRRYCRSIEVENANFEYDDTQHIIPSIKLGLGLRLEDL